MYMTHSETFPNKNPSPSFIGYRGLFCVNVQFFGQTKLLCHLTNPA